ncbi:hypothetical protein D3C71_1412160 [compost metagenome]
MVQDRADLGDHLSAGTQKRWSEWLQAFNLALQVRLHYRIAMDTRHIGVARAGILQRQPHELAAALDAGPVIQFVMHAATPYGTGLQHGPCCRKQA